MYLIVKIVYAMKSLYCKHQSKTFLCVRRDRRLGQQVGASATQTRRCSLFSYGEKERQVRGYRNSQHNAILFHCFLSRPTGARRVRDPCTDCVALMLNRGVLRVKANIVGIGRNSRNSAEWPKKGSRAVDHGFERVGMTTL